MEMSMATRLLQINTVLFSILFIFRLVIILCDIEKYMEQTGK